MNILNAYPYEIGYDWKSQKIKSMDQEMKRYQYDVLNLNNTHLKHMIIDYLKSLSWIVDYYMNTNYKSTSTMISTWSYNYDRSPFISHIFQFINTLNKNELQHIMEDTYQKSLIKTKHYIDQNKHNLYIYPQKSDVISKLPNKYQEYFPNMNKYVDLTIQMANNSKNNLIGRDKKHERVFDCRMCPYFSKCVFKNKMISYEKLKSLNVNSIKH